MKNMELKEQKEREEQLKKKRYDELFKKFNTQRNKILKDIDNFLKTALDCLHELYLTLQEKKLVTPKIRSDIGEHLNRLIKSLCLIHALYGYPGEAFDKGAPIDKNAIKNIVENLKKDSKFTELFNCCRKEQLDDDFWKIGKLDQQNPDRFSREPAHVFLEMVKQVYSGLHEDPFKTVRKCLKNLKSDNLLKPAMWAEHKEKSSYGVSVGVGAFVRPLYLYKKLCTLKDGENDGECINWKKVDAFKILHTEDENEKNTKESPCLTCQCRFGFTSPPIIGNCAEYDVFGNIGLDSLEEEDGEGGEDRKVGEDGQDGKVGEDGKVGAWNKFKLACEGHLAAFDRMNQEIMSKQSRKDEVETIKKYFGETYKSKPKVLKYKWDSETKRYKLIAMFWPQRFDTI